MNIFARELVQLLKEHDKKLGNLYGQHSETHQIYANKVSRLKQSLEKNMTATLSTEDLRVLADWLKLDPEGKEIQRLQAARAAEIVRFKSGRHMSLEAAQEQGERAFQSLIAEKAIPQASQTAKPRVFVSHSHKNDDFTARFVADLRAAGVEVWVDILNIQYGDFITHINKALNTCEWLVLVLTPEALASRFVRWEVNIAITMTIDQELKGIIPFMALPCDPKSIPPILKPFQRYDATKDYKTALAGLLRALGVE